MGVKKDLYNVNEEVRSAAGGFLIEAVGGTASGAKLLAEQERDLEKLNNATGKEHIVTEGDVNGIYVGKAQLGDDPFARIEQEDGSFVLSKWGPEMTKHLGKEVGISRGAKGELSISRADTGSIERER